MDKSQPVSLNFQSILSGKHRGDATPLVTPSRNNPIVLRGHDSDRGSSLGNKRAKLVIGLNALAILLAIVSIVCSSTLSSGGEVQLNAYCVFDVFTNSCDSSSFSDNVIAFPYSRVNRALYSLESHSEATSKPYKNKRSRFVVPFDGIYYLHFRGYKGTHSCDTKLDINGKSELFKCPTNSYRGGLVSWSIMKRLKRKDVVILKSARHVYSNETFFSCSQNKKMEFIGQLIETKETVYSQFVNK